MSRDQQLVRQLLGFRKDNKAVSKDGQEVKNIRR